jgi:hypothetical protein
MSGIRILVDRSRLVLSGENSRPEVRKVQEDSSARAAVPTGRFSAWCRPPGSRLAESVVLAS